MVYETNTPDVLHIVCYTDFTVTVLFLTTAPCEDEVVEETCLANVEKGWCETKNTQMERDCYKSCGLCSENHTLVISVIHLSFSADRYTNAMLLLNNNLCTMHL